MPLDDLSQNFWPTNSYLKIGILRIVHAGRHDQLYVTHYMKT